MATFRDVFADTEITNWLKAWLGLNITRAGLLNFVENEMKQLKSDLYQGVIFNKNLPLTTACTSCSTANLLKCPIKGLCKRTGKTCITVHADPAKQYRSCPNSICDGIRDEIIKAHQFSSPSWKNTTAEQWISNHWEIAKCFMPPDGYTGVSLIQNTDFNGIINVLLNCKHFGTKFSFKIGSGLLTPPCFLTKARDIGKAVRHSSTCKVTSADLKKFFKVFIGILTDSRLLAQDPSAQEAINKLKQLQTDSLNIASEEMVQLLKDAQEVLIDAKKVTHDSKLELKTYIEKLEGQIQLLNSRVDECEQKIQHLQTSMDSVKKTNSKGTDYNQDVLEFQRRLKQYYLDNLRHVPVSPLMPTHDQSLMKIYVTPEIHRIVTEKDGKKRKADQIFKYNDIFQKDHKTKKHVFLQGEPGKGKSTFAAKLVLDWCNDCATTSNSNVKNPHFDDVEILQAYKFVFHIALRESKSQRNLTEMIKKQIIKTMYAEKDVDAAYILLQHIFEKETCLVVQDGLDEWCDPEKELVMPFIAQTFQCSVLITTRPWKMSDERLKNSQFDCLLELEGVMDTSMLSKNILGCLISEDLYNKHALFNKYVRENSLEGLILIPFMLTHIVCLWVHETTLTGSACQIYSLILDSLLKKNSSKGCRFQCPPFKCFENTIYLQTNYDHIQSISRAAFYLLFSLQRDSALVFNDIVLLEHLSEEQKVFALNSGIISEKKTTSLSFKPSTMSFIHKSIQEFLAALYIALNVNVIDDVLSVYFIQTPDAWFDIYQVFIFVCGLNIGAANRISSMMNSHFITYLNNHYRRNYLERYIDSFQDTFITGFLEAKSNNFKDQEVNLQLNHFNFDIDENKHCALKSLLSDNVCNVQSLVFSTYKYPDLLGYDVLSSSAHCLQYLQIGDSISFLYETIRDTYTKLDLSLLQRLQKLHVFEHYVELLPLCRFLDMKSLILNCKCEGLDLQSFENLRELKFGDQVTLVPNDLYELNNLESLSLECKYVGLDLTSCKNLKDIRLGKHITLLPFALRDLHQVQKLNLECKCDGLGLQSFKNLRELELGEHVTLVPNALCELNNLESLSLKCKYGALDLTSCKNLMDITLGKHITLLPFALRDLYQVQKLELECKCDGLDLPSFKNLRELELGEHVTLVPNALYELNNLVSLSLACKYDGLDLTSCKKLKRIKLDEHVKLLPNTLQELRNLNHLNLRCMCDGLDLSSCTNLKDIRLGKHITLLPFALRDLHQVQELELECKCDGLDLQSFKNLRRLELGKHVTLVPNALYELNNLESLSLECKYDGLDLTSCKKLKRIVLYKHVKLLPNALQELRNLDYLSLICMCEGLDLSSCTNLKDILLGEHITLLPFALRDLHQVQTLNLKCKWDGLDLPSFKNLRGLELGKHVTFVPNALYELNNLESLSLKCKYDGLDLTSFKKLKWIELDEHVKLLPNALQELRNLVHLDLRCMCDGLDFSSCTNLKNISLGEHITLLPNTLRELHNMKNLQLVCQYDGLELSLYRKLVKLMLGKKVTLLPCVLRDLPKLQCLTLYCKCEGLDLSSCHSLKDIKLGKLVTLLPNSLRDLSNLEHLTLRCKYEGLDLSSCQNLLTLKIGKQVTLLPNRPENIRGQVSFVDDIDSDTDDEHEYLHWKMDNHVAWLKLKYFKPFD